MEKLNKTKVYYAWTSMKARCFNPKKHNYPRYGGRGITVCDRWLDFSKFLEDMGEPPTKKHSLDRINNDGNYQPSNCRWATPLEQTRNMSTSQFVEFNGKRKSIKDWATEIGMTYRNLYCRLIDKDWTVERALTQKLKKMPRRKRAA